MRGFGELALAACWQIAKRRCAPLPIDDRVRTLGLRCVAKNDFFWFPVGFFWVFFWGDLPDVALSRGGTSVVRFMARSGPDSREIDCPETLTAPEWPWGKTAISAVEVTSLAVAFPSSKKRSRVEFGQRRRSTSSDRR